MYVVIPQSFGKLKVERITKVIGEIKRLKVISLAHNIVLNRIEKK